MVLSAHPDIKKVTDAWMAMAEVLTKSMGQSFCDALEEARKRGLGGVLRYGDEMRLAKLSERSLDAAYYELPDDASQAQAGRPAPQPEDGADLDHDARDIGMDARQATKDELKGNIRDAISDLFN